MTMTAKRKFTRAERGQARRVATRLMTQERREFESDSSPGVVYTAVILVDGKVQCNCRGWTIKKEGQPRQCKHTVALVAGRPLYTPGDGEFLYIMPGDRS